MNYFDIAVLIFLALGLIIGLFKGFIKPLVTVIGWGVGFALIYFFSDNLAGVFASTDFNGIVVGGAEKFLAGLGANGEQVMVLKDGVWLLANGTSLTDAVMILPDFLVTGLSANFVEGATLFSNLSFSITKYIMTGLSAIIMMLGTGIVFSIIGRIVSKMAYNNGKGAINRIAGGLLYLTSSVFLVGLIVMGLNMLTSTISIPALVEIMDSSWIMSNLGQYNPIELIINSIVG